MAEPIRYDVPAEDPEKRKREEAYAELDRLVLLLHEHQVLRLANDAVAALSSLSQIMVDELDNDEGKRGIENLYVLARTLGKLPSEELQRVTRAAGYGFSQMGRHAPEDEPYPPGLSGVFKHQNH